jgi:hypothetical protein
MTALPLATTAGEIAALIVALVAAVLVVGLLVMLRSLNATLRALRLATDELRRSTEPLLVDVREAVTQANTELERVDGLLVTAESISTTVDSASRLAYLAFSNPVIKTLAFTTGTGRAVRRLRRRSERR